MAFGVTCPTCGKAFSITDEIYQRKVSGRVVTIKCKQCQGGIRVDASKPGVTKISAAAKEAVADKAIETKSVGPLPPQALAAAVAPAPRVRQATLIGGVADQMGKQARAAAAAMTEPSAPPPPAPAPPPPPAAATPPPELLWAVEVGDGQDREMSFSELRRELERGSISATALVWRDGMAEWLEIRQVPELAPYVKKAAQPKPAPAAPPPVSPAPPVAASPPLPPAAPKPAVKAAPMAPRIAPAPVSEDVPTQPKSPGFPPPPAPLGSAPKLPPPPPRASAPDPFAPPPFAPPPAASPPSPPVAASPPPAPVAEEPPPEPTFPAAAPAAPAPAPRPPTPFQLAPSAVQASPAFAPMVSAPPAPVPVARPAPTFATPGPVSASTDFEMPKVRSKAPLVIGAVAVIGALIAAFVLIQGAEKQPVPLSPVAESPPIATATTPSTPRAATATPTSTPTAAANEAPPSNAEQTTPGSGFAELFASGAREKEGDKVAARFDPAAAKKAVAKTLTGVGKCKEPGGPRGNVSATVTFDSSGKVSTVSITDPPFAGSSTASCLTAMLKQATMPPFKGLPGTHTQTISVR